MKTKRLLLKAVSAALVVFMLLSAIPATAFAAQTDTYSKITSGAELESGKYVMVFDSGYAVGPMTEDKKWISSTLLESLGDKLTGIDSSLECTLTVSGEKVKLMLSDGEYISPLGGNTNGIKNNEYDWAYSVTNEGKFVFSGTGDDTVYLAGNKTSAYKLRAYKQSTCSNKTSYPSEFSLYKLDSEQAPVIAAPMAAPASGEVSKGTEITLSSATNGAEIYYTLDGSDPTNADNAARVLYNAQSKPVITQACTLKAVAVLGDAVSEVQTLSYEIGAPLKNGEKVVIYAPAYNKALSGEYGGFYNNGTDVTVAEDGTVTGFTNADVWTVIANADETYSFSYNGQNIAMADSYSSMPLGEKNDKWSLEENADGTYYIKNVVRGAYMEWYSSKNWWSGYGSISEGSEGMFAVKFFKVTDTTEEPDPTEPSEPSEVEGLKVEASPKSGASVSEGQLITLKSADNTEIYFTMSTDGTAPADPDITNAEQKYSAPIEIKSTPEKDKPVIIKAVASSLTEEKTGEVVTLTYKAPSTLSDYNVYFGQLHAHTNLSDGTGTVAQAYDHASKVENLDFLALTDHSNSFDGASADAKMHLGDSEAEQISNSWHEGRQGARDINARENGRFLGLYGFEMTWSGGSPGHINTFNSKGFESRNLAPYKKGDNYEVLGAYFNTLNENPETMSQFNHPGDTFGDFMDFALYDTETDNQMTLIEVGNGEGNIGSTGYFPSYSYYTRALDKGWHVAPTNNQDNHKGNWGDSNTARSVVLATDLTEEAVYDAMKNYRVYATEDNDLTILYSLNGNAMGSILDKQEKVTINASISDPTDTEGKTKVEVVVNGGQTVASKTFEGASADLVFDNLPANYGYYYLRITQADKNIAVTAPVWVGESINAGISKTTSSVALPIKGDKIDITSRIYNNLSSDMTVKSVEYTIEGQEAPFHSAAVSEIGENGVIAARGSVNYEFPYTVEQAGGFNINVKMVAELSGEEYTFTDVLKLSVSDPAIATKVLIDGTHYNDYVNGYYAGNMTNFINMGTQSNIQVKVANPGDEITADALKDVALFVISAPLKYTSDYTGDAQPMMFEDSFVKLVAEYVQNGGNVVVCGLADYQDSKDGVYTTYKEDNKLLEAIGSTMRVNDDELLDQDENGGTPYRLYFTKFNTDSKDETVQKMLSGVEQSQLPYSSYSGCSVSVGNGHALVYGHDTTYSINSKAPTQGHDKPVTSYKSEYDPDKAVMKKGEVVAMAYEQVGKGKVFVSGTVFCSNFEVSAEDQVSYSNGIIAKNLLDMVEKVPVQSTIEQARAGQFGEVFTVTGTVANGTAEAGNAFFNTIYIQDENGNGINVFPIDDSNIRRGDRVTVTGSVSEYIGDKQLSAINVKVLEEKGKVVVTTASTKEANNYEKNFGKLVNVNGEVKSVRYANGIIDSIEVCDESGESCRVFIDGYVDYSDKASTPLEQFVSEGVYINATGFVSHDAEGNRLRVRDRSEIKLSTKVERLKGDVNGDGIVDIIDVTTIQKYLAGIEVNTFVIEEADVDGNGGISIADATTLQKILAGYTI